RLIYDLSQQLWTAERVPDERFIATTPYGITVPAASTLRYSLPLPPASRLTGWVEALPTPGTGLVPDTAVVRVNNTDIWTTRLRSSAAPVPFSLDLSPWAGQVVRLELVVLGEPTFADQRPAVVAWGQPQIQTAAPWLRPYAAEPALFAFAPPVASGLAGQLDLLNVALDKAEYAAGDTAVVRLDWHAAVPTTAYGTLFVHLLDEAGNLVAQVDAPAGPVAYPTAVWQPGLIIQDEHALQLPADLPAGDYTLALGLYEGGSGARWSVVGGEDGEDGRVFWPEALAVEMR
ncbi:MAG: hypothetical protein KDD89_06795, partial [Anaerolineales bacterium]|nr:hypothetical protein [Anaerolineales bacterium]